MSDEMHGVKMDELYHHGILGMKWGVRRSQSQTGRSPSSTRKKIKSIDAKASAKIRKINKEGKDKDRILKAKEKADAKVAAAKSKYKSTDTKRRSIKEMSDDEIRSKINRIKLENELKSLTPQQVSKGKRFVNMVGKDIVGPAAKDASKYVLTNWLKAKGLDVLDIKVGKSGPSFKIGEENKKKKDNDDEEE